MKKNKYEIDMCNGTIMDKLISFSLPLMLSGILQLMFNAVDIIVVGRFSGSEALAAVGCVLCLMLLAMVGWKSVYAIVMLAGLWVFLPKRQAPQAR